jgi:hypothetical protein
MRNSFEFPKLERRNALRFPALRGLDEKRGMDMTRLVSAVDEGLKRAGIEVRKTLAIQAD